MAESAAAGISRFGCGDAVSNSAGHAKGTRNPLVLHAASEHSSKAIGALGFGTSKVSAYGESDLQLLPRVAELIALAVENALMRQALKEEKERLQSLVEINSLLV